MAPMLDIAYCSVDSETRRLDLFAPSRPNGAGILFIHGGGWSGGNRRQWHGVAEHYTNLGYVCASMSYHLSPASRFPKQVEDVRLAMEWFKRRSAALGCERERVAAWGSSAGGHLAALLGTIASEDDLGATPELVRRNTRPAALVLYCSVLTTRRGERPEANQKILDAFFGPDMVDDEETVRLSSPLERVTAATPPTLMVTGRHDMTTPLNLHVRFQERLREYGTRCALEVLPDAGHGFGYGVTSDNQKIALAAADRFLESVLLDGEVGAAATRR